MNEPEPEAVVLAGDWHGDLSWAKARIAQLPEFLPDEKNPIIIHVGDFGIWYGNHGKAFVDGITESLRRVNGYLHFIEGNHENYVKLQKHASVNPRTADGKIMITENIFWIPRNHRWSWQGKTWVGLGGAISVDRCYRTEGESVFAEEAITDAEFAQAAQDGPCDVLIAHDCPSMAPLALGAPDPAWALADLARADVHREKMQDLVNVIQPELIVHGHYHLRQSWTGKYENGKDVRVVSLDMNTTSGNIVVADTKTLWVS